MSDKHNLQLQESGDRLDQVLRQELRWEAPPDLSLRLLGLVPGLNPMVVIPRPKPWYSTVVLVLTAIAVGLSLAVAWQFYGMLGAEMGLSAIWDQLRAAPGLGLLRLYEALPASRNVVAVLVAVRDQLHWLLLAIVLWLALDGWQPRLSRRTVSQ
ncbi:MAG: anti-sigma factor [Oscillochloris sp.]|nr:anti-sigma factor [Oscillochloris sp.]